MPGLASPYPLGQTLPSLYRDDVFAQNLCDGLDEVLAPIIATLDSLPAYLDPGTVPDDMLGWLAGLDGDRAGRAPERGAATRTGPDRASSLLQWRGTARGVAAAVDALFEVTPEIVESGGACLVGGAEFAVARVRRSPNCWSGSGWATRRVSTSAGWMRSSR